MLNTSTQAKKAGPRLVTTGLLALDVVIGPETDKPARFWAGGTCGNVSAILSHFDWEVFPVARLGDDSIGCLVLEDLKKWRVKLDFVERDVAIGTPVVIEKLRKDKHGKPYHRFSFTCPSCGAWLPSYRPPKVSRIVEWKERIPNPAVFFFDRVSPAALSLATTFAEGDTLIVFEPSGIGDPRLFRQAMELAHVVKYSHERVRELAELRPSLNPLLEIETLGEDGLRYRRRIRKRTERWSILESLAAGVVRDSAGAGDWCTAGILSCLGLVGAAGISELSASELTKAIRYGQALAAWSCRYEGPRGGMYQSNKTEMLEATSEILAGDGPTTIVDAFEPQSNSGVAHVVCLECSGTTGEKAQEQPARSTKKRSPVGSRSAANQKLR